MRHLIRAALAAVLLPVVASSAHAQALGAGELTCSQYLKAARSSDIVYHQASNWLLGYASGMNAALRSVKVTPAVEPTREQVLKAAGDYCEANPSATIATAANEWQASLPKPVTPAAAAQSGSGTFTINLDRPKDPSNFQPSLRGGKPVCAKVVMAGHSRPKDGVASLAYVPAMPRLCLPHEGRRGCPRQARA